MEKYLRLVSYLVIVIAVSSCRKTDDFPTLEEKQAVRENSSIKHTNPVVSLPVKSLKWDESYHPHLDSPRSFDADEYLNESSEMVVTDKRCFIGKVYTADHVRTLTFGSPKHLGNLKPITATFMFPGYYSETFKPQTSTMMRALNNALKNPDFSGEQSASFEYDYKAFSHYNELKLAFGADVNVGNILKIDASATMNKIKHKTGMCIRLFQRYFSIISDYPEDGNIFTSENELQRVLPQSPVYVSSVSFGRLAIIVIESDYSYQELQAAFKASLSAKVVNGNLSLDATSKKILNESHINIFVSGGKGSEVAEIVKGSENMYSFIANGANFTRTTHGVPISFTASYASDHSVFKVYFKASGE